MKKGIAIVGSIVLDQHYSTDYFPLKNTLTTVQKGEESLGGTGNLIIDLAKIDSSLPIKVCGKIGKDANGDKVIDSLNQYENIETKAIVKNSLTSTTIVVDAKNDKSRTFFYSPGTNDEFSFEDINWELLYADIFQLEYLLLLKKIDSEDKKYGTVAAKILSTAKTKGFKTSIDMVSEISERANKLIPFALKYTDYCTINEIEAEQTTKIKITENNSINDNMVKKALFKLKEMGVSTWVIIHCSKACYGLDCKTNKIIKMLSLDIPRNQIKGTTGAGDAFCSGILYSIYKNKTLLESLRFASATAACSLFEENGTDGLRKSKDVWDLYNEYVKEGNDYEEI